MKSNSQKGEFVSRSRSFTVSEFQSFRVSGFQEFQEFQDFKSFRVLHFGDDSHNQDKKSSCTRRGEGGV
jgi:hypothetical protein